MRRQSLAFLLVVAASAVSAVSMSIAKRFEDGADVDGVDDETRSLRVTGAHRGKKKDGARTIIPRTNKKTHVRPAPAPQLMRMRGDQSPPPACGSYELVSGADDCVISELFWQDYTMKLTNIQPGGGSVRFDVVQDAQEMCQYREDIECLWVTAFPSDMTAGTQCSLLEDVDCGDKGKFTVDINCNGQSSVFVDVFSREGLKLRNNVPNGILVPAACASLAAQKPNAFHRNYMCHKRFQVSCVACGTPS